MPALQGTTTVRVSRLTRQVLSQLAAQEGCSISDLLDQLVERARRQEILTVSTAHMAEIMATPEERRSYMDELSLSEAAADAVLRQEPAYDDEQCRA